MALKLGARRRPATKPYRMFFATDIHGSDRCFRKFVVAAAVYEVDALVLGGDVAGKGLVPIADLGDGRYELEFQGQLRTVTSAELDSAIEAIGFNGFYTWIATPDQIAGVAADEGRKEELFAAQIAAQIERWCDLVTERLDEHVACVITPGNDDPYSIDDVLKRADRIACPERKLFELGPVMLASLGNTNRTPWDSEREFDEEQLTAQIDSMLAEHDGSVPLAFNVHCPPYDSGLDTATLLDAEFRPVLEHGMPVELHAGSTAVREAILRYQPTVALHGHIHESRGVTRLGRTICINPGSDYSSGVLTGCIVELGHEGSYRDHLLTTG